MLRRRSRRPNRRPRRRNARKSNFRGSSTKVYNFKANLLPEYLVSTTGSAPGTLAVVTDQATPAPITNVTQGSPDAAGSGIPYHYSFGQGLVFSLADLQRDNQFFTTAFDQYRINSVTCKITYTSSMAGATSSSVNPTLYMYVDRDDGNIPTSIAGVLGKQGLRRFEFNDRSKTSTSITFKPKVLTSLFDGSATTTYAGVARSGWLDCAHPAIQHYGLKMWWENVPLVGTAVEPNPNSVLQFEFIYNISVRAPLNLY